MPLPTIPLQRLDGSEFPGDALQGKVLLVVNVASRCGFTPQYTGLEALHRQFGEQGLVVLGFPCDQFGHQEPGDAEEIARFCSLDYPVSFPLMAKCEVNGDQAHPFYRWLKQQNPGCSGARPSNGTSPSSCSIGRAGWWTASPPRPNPRIWRGPSRGCCEPGTPGDRRPWPLPHRTRRAPFVLRVLIRDAVTACLRHFCYITRPLSFSCRSARGTGMKGSGHALTCYPPSSMS